MKSFKMLLLSLCVTILWGQTYKIGVEDISYYPLYSNEKNEYKGYAREVLDAFAKEKGYSFEYVALPVKRLFHSYINNKVDFKFPDNPYWEKAEKEKLNVTYSSSVTDYIDGVMVLKEKKGSGISALKVLGIVRGFTPWDYLGLINEKKVKLSENNSFPALLKQTMIKRVDGAYANPVVAKYQLMLLDKKDALVFDPSLPYTHSDYYMSSIKYPEVIKEFTKFLKDNKAVIDKLKEKYNIYPPKVK